MKQKGFVPVLILVLIALVVTGYLGYKYFKSSNQLSTNPSPTPIPTIVSTENWKTYMNSECGSYWGPMPFSIKTPSDMKETVGVDNDKDPASYTYSKDGLSIKIVCGDGFGGGGCGLKNELIQNKIMVNSKEQSACLERDLDKGGLVLWLTYLNFSDNMPGFSFTANADDTLENIDLINTILSTFKFTGAIPTPSSLPSPSSQPLQY